MLRALRAGFFERPVLDAPVYRRGRLALQSMRVAVGTLNGHLMALNYKHLRYFWAVAHGGNLTRAATQLHVSQSALSVQIKKLEEWIGHDLFERRGNGLFLTEAGSIALDYADTIFGAGDELVNTLKGHDTTAMQALRVGAISTLSRNFQWRFLAPLFKRDDVLVVVRSGSQERLLSDLESHAIDVVLTNVPPLRDASTRWVVHTISEQRISLIGTHDVPDAGGDLTTLLRDNPLIVPTVETSIRTGFDALCERLDVRPVFRAEVDDMALIRVLARSGRAVAVIPPIVVRDELQSGLLHELAPLPGLTESFAAITLPRRFPNPLLAGVLHAFNEEHSA
ncbi:MAG: LysR family transcriptional regulator, partial [Pseudomonadota bacterium]